jgi:hypothetical protein
VIAPVEELSESPLGRAGVTPQLLYGGVPPVAVRVVLYGLPTVALGSGEVVVIVSGVKAGFIVRLSDLVVDLLAESCTENV